MNHPSDLVQDTIDQIINENTLYNSSNVLQLASNLDDIISELAEIILDKDITFNDKFQAIADINYVSDFLAIALLTIDKSDIDILLNSSSKDPFYKIMKLIH